MDLAENQKSKIRAFELKVLRRIEDVTQSRSVEADRTLLEKRKAYYDRLKRMEENCQRRDTSRYIYLDT